MQKPKMVLRKFQKCQNTGNFAVNVCKEALLRKCIKLVEELS